MKRQKILLLVVLILNSMMARSQMSDKVEELIKLGRDSVIHLAVEQLKSAGFESVDPGSFDRLRIKTNGAEIMVLFDRSIHYVPKNSRVIHQATVRLLDNFSGWMPLENDYKEKEGFFTGNINFYEYSEEDQKAIDFVFMEEINIQENDRLVIYEKDDYYDVTLEFDTTEGGYKVDKKTGKRYDDWHVHLEPDPFSFEEEFRDIDW